MSRRSASEEALLRTAAVHPKMRCDRVCHAEAEALV
jgi:hypothetical protein